MEIAENCENLGKELRSSIPPPAYPGWQTNEQRFSPWLPGVTTRGHIVRLLLLGAVTAQTFAFGPKGSPKPESIVEDQIDNSAFGGWDGDSGMGIFVQ